MLYYTSERHGYEIYICEFVSRQPVQMEYSSNKVLSHYVQLMIAEI